MSFKPYKQELREKNLVRYKGTPPSIELVNKCIEQSKLSRRSFELTYGIVEKTIERYQNGLRDLPTIYWHIFYEFNNLEKFYSNFKVKIKREKKIEEQKATPVISQTNKSLIDAYRAKLSQR